MTETKLINIEGLLILSEKEIKTVKFIRKMDRVYLIINRKITFYILNIFGKRFLIGRKKCSTNTAKCLG